MAAYNQYATQQNMFRNDPNRRPSVHHGSPTRPSGSGQAAATPSGSTLAQPAFKAPAHKHAHHLHSIPPREKSTRTLIIDHMLWVHGRTCFAQARAELGMTDRTGGPSSPNYTHRRRPENYKEEDELRSEGEEAGVLKARSGARNDEEDERLRRQDLTLARSLRLRAEGLEKVVTSMLEQPPPIHPINDDDILSPPTSPKLNPRKHPHTLPNGVRLRLALGTIINDLFARQAPHPPYRHTHLASPPKAASPAEHTPPISIPASFADLPEALIPLAIVSGAFSPPPPPIAPYSYTPPRTYPQQFASASPPSVQHTDTLSTPNTRTRALYAALTPRPTTPLLPSAALATSTLGVRSARAINLFPPRKSNIPTGHSSFSFPVASSSSFSTASLPPSAYVSWKNTSRGGP